MSEPIRIESESPRDKYQRQAGSHKQCARHGCTVRPSWRVILGHWVVQVYACQRHLTWAVELDMLAESAGSALEWEHGYPVYTKDGGTVVSRSMRITQVVAEMPAIQRMNYRREVRLSSSWPKYKDHCFEHEGQEYVSEWPVYG